MYVCERGIKANYISFMSDLGYIEMGGKQNENKVKW